MTRPGDEAYWIQLGGVVALYAFFLTQRMACQLAINAMLEKMKEGSR